MMKFGRVEFQACDTIYLKLAGTPSELICSAVT